MKLFILPKKYETRALLRVSKKPQLGEQTITINLNMQACNESVCFAGGGKADNSDDSSREDFVRESRRPLNNQITQITK